MFYGKFTDEGDNPVDNVKMYIMVEGESVLKIFFFQSCSVIVLSMPQIILLSSTKHSSYKHLQSNFGIIKQILPSYEVNIKITAFDVHLV